MSCPEPQVHAYQDAPQNARTGRLHALVEGSQQLQHPDQQMHQMLQQLGAYSSRGLSRGQIDLRTSLGHPPEPELRTKHSAPTPDSSSELALLNRYHPTSSAENTEALTVQDLLSILGPRSISGRREETPGALNVKAPVSPAASDPTSPDDSQEPHAPPFDSSADPSLRPKMSAPLPASASQLQQLLRQRQGVSSNHLHTGNTEVRLPSHGCRGAAPCLDLHAPEMKHTGTLLSFALFTPMSCLYPSGGGRPPSPRFRAFLERCSQPATAPPAAADGS